MNALFPFAIVSDIDGVLTRYKVSIGNSPEAVAKIQDMKIPFLALTNNGVCTEKEKADAVSKLLSLSD
jgi:ribonucleotide monophosphatase NagD (HAD superfamily)